MPTPELLPGLEEHHQPFTVPDEIVALVERVLPDITYKPGWSFESMKYTGDVLYILAKHTEPNTRRPDEELPDFQRRIPLRWPTYCASTVEAVCAWVRHCIHEWEAHEADEWLRYKGRHVHDPHACLQCRIGGCRA